MEMNEGVAYTLGCFYFFVLIWVLVTILGLLVNALKLIYGSDDTIKEVSRLQIWFEVNGGVPGRIPMSDNSTVEHGREVLRNRLKNWLINLLVSVLIIFLSILFLWSGFIKF